MKAGGLELAHGIGCLWGKKLKITGTASHQNTLLIQAIVHLQNKGAFLVIFAWKQITNSTNMRIKRLISA